MRPTSLSGCMLELYHKKSPGFGTFFIGMRLMAQVS